MSTKAAPASASSDASKHPPNSAGKDGDTARPPNGDGQPAVPELSNRQLLVWMFSFLKPVQLHVVIACLFLIGGISSEIATTGFMGRAVNQIQHLHRDQAVSDHGFWSWMFGAEPSARELRWVIFILSGLIVAVCVLRYFRETSSTSLSMNMVFFIREAVYDKIQRVGFAFHDRVSTGQLINRALTDLQNVRAFIQSAVLTTLDIVLVVGGYIILILFLNPWVALLALVPLPFWTWYILKFGKAVQPASKAVMEAEDKNVSIITENIAGVHVVKAFATEKQEIDKYSTAADDYFNRVRSRIRLFANFTPVMRSIATASHLSLYLVAGIMIIKGKMQVGDLLILGAAMGNILMRLQQVSVISDQYQNAIVSAKRLHEVLAAPPTTPARDGAALIPQGPGAVRFENVTFGYDPERPVLKEVSFEVPGGKVVAIVGPTGAGKTTLVSLIARFYDPQQGRITIDGVDVRELSLDSIRQSIAFVFQETHLFSDTVGANVAYGRPGQGESAVEAAARLAQAHDFVEELPKGYETVLAERGASLSGGQKQRLAIARAILSNPRILVLDDATAAIDPATEDFIRKGMRHVMHDRTTFLIAHRISSVKSADLVIVLEHGRITQIGKHSDLMAQDGHYRMIAAAQLRGDDDDVEENPSHMKRMKDEQHVAAAANVAPTEVQREEP